MEKCFNCEENFSGDKLTEVNGELYCSECMDENFISCEKCRELIHIDDYIEAGNGDIICEYCLDDHYTKCDDCGEYFPNDDVYYDGNIHLCENCMQDYYTCQNCGEYVHENDTFCYDGEVYCQYCYERIKPFIHDYHYKPEPIFYGEGKKYFGIEIEIDGGGEDNEKAENITQNINYSKEHVYCKHDGSLDEGFEIVTHPMSYNYITKIKNDFRIMMEAAINEGYVSHNAETCGLHIHVSRRFFGECEEQQDLHISKILFLIEKHWNKMVIFSRRTEAQLNRWASRYCEEGESLNSNNILEKAKISGRYHAINLENEHTIEFRFFRGTLKFNTFIATIQFVHHLTDLAKNLSLQETQSLQWDKIVNINENEYPELAQYLRERKLK